MLFVLQSNLTVKLEPGKLNSEYGKGNRGKQLVWLYPKVTKSAIQS